MGSADIMGARVTCLAAAAMSTTCTLLLSVLPPGTPLLVYMLLWGANILTILGILGISRSAVASNWIPHSHLGRLMGIISMSSDLGDVVSRVLLAPFLAWGWRPVFQVAAAFCFCTSVVPLLFFGDAPQDQEDTIQVANEIAKARSCDKPKRTFWQKAKLLLSSVMLYALCAFSSILYGTRNMFLNYSPILLAEVRCRDAEEWSSCLASPETLASTAVASCAFTLTGCVSPEIVGILKDSLPDRHRAAPLVIFVTPLVVTMAFLALAWSSLSYWSTVVVMAVIGVFLAGPLKIMKVFAMDVAGKEAKATAMSLVGVSTI